mmetsp:Transcript_29395/g.73814  ORF Transcript_29395/g.73814 Transcript_29395/m.73814 type:complete len:189 (-) Transcript_29395:300-866(-)
MVKANELGRIYVDVKLPGDGDPQLLLRFRMTSSMPFRRLMESFCQRTGADRRTCQFLLAGDLIRNEDTPMSLGIENGGIIDALGSISPIFINVRQVIEHGDRESKVQLTFKMWKFTPLHKMMDYFCRTIGVDRQVYRFLFNGEWIEDDDTPISLEMDNEDFIDAIMNYSLSISSEIGGFRSIGTHEVE